MKLITTKRIVTIVLVCLFGNLGLEVAIDFVANLLNNYDFMSTWAWLYSGLFILLTFTLLRKVIPKWEIRFGRLVLFRIGLALIIYVMVVLLHISPIWNIHNSSYKYILLDDEEYYYDDTGYDDDPVFGTSQSGSSSSFKYFLPIETDLEGYELPIGTIEKYDDSPYFIRTEYDEIYPYFSRKIFWQAAYVDGYIPVNKDEYLIGGFFKQIYQIGPYYLFEQLFSGVGTSILFTIIVLFTSILFPKFRLISHIDYNKLGLERMEAGDYKASLTFFDQALIQDSKNAEHYYNRAKARVHSQTFYEDAFNKGYLHDYSVAKKNSKETYDFFNLSIEEDKLEEYSLAVEDFKKASELEINNSEIFSSLGFANYKTKNYKGAIEALSRAIEINPSTICFSYRAQAKYHLEDYEGAIDDFRKLILSSSSSYIPYDILGQAKYYSRDFTGAVEDYTKAIDLDPEDDCSFHNRGLAKYGLKDYAGAIEDYNKAIELDPDHYLPYQNRAKAKREIGDLKGAKEDGTKAMDLDPKIIKALDDLRAISGNTS